MPNTSTRKPTPQTNKEPAQNVLNRFLADNDILIGTQTPHVEFTESGAMIVHPPKVIAVYKETVKPNKPIN